MGLGSPKTKAACDRDIAAVQARIAQFKANIASMPNGKPGSAEACQKAQSDAV